MAFRRHCQAWLVLPLSLALAGSAQDTVESEGPAQVVLEPEELHQVVEGSQHLVRWQALLPSVARLTYRVEDEMVAEVTSVGEVERGAPGDNFTYYGYLNITALFIGYDKIYVTLYDALDVVVGEGVVSMSVLLSYQSLSDLFTLLIGVLVAVMYVSMGAVIDLRVVKSIAKRPVGPVVGMVCQYLFMPLIAFGIGRLAFPGQVLAQLGLFLMGCCPGGGASNMWTHLLDSSLDLSIMMTFVSSVMAFAAVPLWVLLMGPVIMADAEFYIPYKDIAILVFSLSVPCLIGILSQRFFPRVTKVLRFLLTPITVFNLVFIFTFGVYANRYIFRLFDAKIVIAGLGLPTLGYVSGLCLASIFRLPVRDRVAISIETGIQNATLALFILKLTLEKPAGDLTVVYPAASVIMTPVPLVIVLILHRVYLCHRDKSSSPEEPQGSIKEELEMKNGTKDKQVDSTTVEVDSVAGKVDSTAGKVDSTAGKVDSTSGQVARSKTDNCISLPNGGVDNPAADLREEDL